VVLERGEVAHSWRTERWDSLRLLTPNWLTRLPGFAYRGADPDGFMTGPRQRPPDAGATGGAAARRRLPDPRRLQEPGPGPRRRRPGRRRSASGAQIADELLRHGHPVTIAVGEHVRVPRRYRGADMLWWMESAGVLDERYDEMDDLVRARSIPSMQLAGSPGGQPLDLNALTSRGARLVGRLSAIRDGRALFSGSLPNVCALADLKLGRLLDTIDAWVAEEGVEPPEPPHRLAPTAVPSPPPLDLDLRSGEIRSVVWATGNRPDLSWLQLPVVGARGRLLHDGGVTAFPGLYLMGMPFLRRRKSTLIDGARADARELSAHLADHLDSVAHGRVSALL
jgi:putative flavoprotein involved in K+ transport